MRAAITLLAVALFPGHGAPRATAEHAPAGDVRRPAAASPAGAAASADARSFLAAVRGADPVICSLAAAPVGNGWGDTGAPRPDDEAGAPLVAWALKPSLADRDLTILEEGLRGADDCVRTMSARLLAEAEGGPAILIDALDEPSAAIRRAAAEGLGFAETIRATGALGGLLADDADAGVRAAAAWALGRIEDPSAEAALGRALRDPAPFVRRAAVHALGALELESSIELLIPMLSDDDARTRVATAHALGRLH